MKKRITRLQEKTTHLSNHLSVFDEYKTESLSPTTLRLFEGWDAMETIFLNTTFDEWYFIWDIDMIIDFAGRDIDKVVEKFWYNHIKQQYSLLRESTASIQYLRMVQEKGITNNHIKLLPPEYDLSWGEISLIDGVVSFLIFKNPVKAIVIDNDVVYKNQRLMFETLREYTPEYIIT